MSRYTVLALALASCGTAAPTADGEPVRREPHPPIAVLHVTAEGFDADGLAELDAAVGVWLRAANGVLVLEAADAGALCALCALSVTVRLVDETDPDYMAHLARFDVDAVWGFARPRGCGLESEVFVRRADELALAHELGHVIGGPDAGTVHLDSPALMQRSTDNPPLRGICRDGARRDCCATGADVTLVCSGLPGCDPDRWVSCNEVSAAE